MNEGDLIKVLRELRVYSQKRKFISSKNATCQTDFQDVFDNNNNLPYIYCSRYPSAGEAETQCDIPLSKTLCKSCGGKNAQTDEVAVQCDLSAGVCFASLQNSRQKHKGIDKNETSDFCLPTPCDSQLSVIRLSEENPNFTGSCRDNLKDRQETNHKNDSDIEPYSALEDHDDHQMDDAPGEDSEAEVETPLQANKKIQDLEEEEKIFWAEMKQKCKKLKPGRKPKHIKEKLKNSLKDKNSSCKVLKKNSSGLIKDSLASQAPVKRENDGDVEENEWLTDDEVDDDTIEDVNSEFRAEWKERRVPPNTRVKNFVCVVCDKPYSKHHYLREHIVRDHSEHELAREYKFRCDYCGRVYNGQKQLDHHLSLHCGPCEVCGMMFQCNALFHYHRRLHDAVCEFCRKSFSSLSSLATHKIMAHGKKKYFCNICDKGFVYQSFLKAHVERNHVNVHNMKMPRAKRELKDPKCSECSYVAKNYLSLKIHQGMLHKNNVKKNERVHTCPICGTSLTSKAILKKHIDKHLGRIKRHRCGLCTKFFRTEKKLDSHMKKFHGFGNEDNDTQELHIVSEDQKDYPCESCELCFASPHALQEHIYSVHSVSKKETEVIHDIVYECPYCSSSSDSASNLQAHILSVHRASQSIGNEIVPVVSNSVSVTGIEEEYSVMEVSVTDSEPQVNAVISQPVELPVATSSGAFVAGGTVTLPACAVASGVNMVEINGVNYHVIRNGQ